VSSLGVLRARRGDHGRQLYEALLKLAGLLHDVGKPETKAPDAMGRIRFIGHMALGAEKASNVMRRFRFSGAETRFVSTIVEQHLRPGQMSSSGPPTRRALYRFFRDTSDAALDILFPQNTGAGAWESCTWVEFYDASTAGNRCLPWLVLDSAVACPINEQVKIPSGSGTETGS